MSIEKLTTEVDSLESLAKAIKALDKSFYKFCIKKDFEMAERYQIDIWDLTLENVWLFWDTTEMITNLIKSLKDTYYNRIGLARYRAFAKQDTETLEKVLNNFYGDLAQTLYVMELYPTILVSEDKKSIINSLILTAIAYQKLNPPLLKDDVDRLKNLDRFVNWASTSENTIAISKRWWIGLIWIIILLKVAKVF